MENLGWHSWCHPLPAPHLLQGVGREGSTSWRVRARWPALRHSTGLGAHKPAPQACWPPARGTSAPRLERAPCTTQTQQRVRVAAACAHPPIAQGLSKLGAATPVTRGPPGGQQRRRPARAAETQRSRLAGIAPPPDGLHTRFVGALGAGLSLPWQVPIFESVERPKCCNACGPLRCALLRLPELHLPPAMCPLGHDTCHPFNTCIPALHIARCGLASMRRQCAPPLRCFRPGLRSFTAVASAQAAVLCNGLTWPRTLALQVVSAGAIARASDAAEGL